MTKKQMKLLVRNSYTNGEFNEKLIHDAANSLSRKDLKLFIKMLKTAIDKSVVHVTVPSKENEQLLKDLQKIFPSKYVIIDEDKSLIAGIKIRDYDMIYDLNLKDSLQELVHVTQQL